MAIDILENDRPSYNTEKLTSDMPQRITLLIDDELVWKLREIQAKQLKKTHKSVSFSKVVTDAIRKGIK